MRFQPIAVTIAATLMYGSTMSLQAVKDQSVETVTVKKNDRAKAVSSLNSKYNISNANKVSTKLIKELLNEKKAIYKVDLFIGDMLSKDEKVAYDKYISGRASYKINLENNQTSYTLNGLQATPEEIDQFMSEQNTLLIEKNKLREEKRRTHIKTVLELLKKEKTLEALSDSSSPYITLSLTSNEMKQLLKKAGSAIMSYDVHSSLNLSNTGTEWDNLREGYLRGVSLTQMHGPWNSYFPNTRGENIGIYYSDAHCPANQGELFYGYDETTGSYNEVGLVFNWLLEEDEDDGNSFHTRIITGILGTVANNVDLICHDSHGTEADIDSRFPDDTTNVNIQTYSLNHYNNSSTYSALDASFDHYTFNNRTIPVFVSAGNINSWNINGRVLSPAKAFNVITVGSYGRNLSTGNFSWSDFSGDDNPITAIGSREIQKPEVSAPGESFHCQDFFGDFTCNDDHNESNGTSFATPWTAAMTADVMSQGTYWQNSAAMMKAVVIAGATDPVSGTRDQVGEGGVDLFTMTWQNTNSAYWYDANPTRPFSGTNTDQFDFNNNCFTNWQTNLDGNRDQRIVISWLNDVTDATTLSNVPNSYSLELLNSNGNVVASSSEDTQGYQIINTNQPTGLYTVRVCIDRQDTSQRFDMGFAVSQRSNQWWD
jgi:hypothetical protein